MGAQTDTPPTPWRRHWVEDTVHLREDELLHECMGHEIGEEGLDRNLWEMYSVTNFVGWAQSGGIEVEECLS